MAAIDMMIARAGSAIGLVQVSDFDPDSWSLTRAVPGEGTMPLERILGWILETGYEGLFDLELFGRPLETAPDDVRRGVDAMNGMLERLGV